MVVAVVALVVALLALVWCVVALQRARRAARAAAGEAERATAEAADASRRADAAEEAAAAASATAEAATAGQDAAVEARAAAEARATVEEGRASAAEVRAAEAEGRARAALDEVRRSQGAVAAAGLPWTDALWALERCRVERTWATVAPATGGAEVPEEPGAALRRALEVELQWLREVVGTPGRLNPADEAAPVVAPAALVALRLAQEALDLLAKRSEDLEVDLAVGDGEVDMRVAARELDEVEGPDGQLARLAAAVGLIGGRVEVDASADPAILHLVVPTGPKG